MRKGIALLLILMTVLCFSSYAFASWALRLDGRPHAFHPGNSDGYFIWQDDEGLHLRTTTSGAGHVFEGIIRTDGVLEDVHGRSLEADDRLHVSNDSNKITYKFTTSGGVDGFDLHVCDASYVTFNLSMDGDDMDTNNIFIGRDDWHPGSNKFTLRHEKNPGEYHDDETVIIIGGYHWWHFHDHYWHRHWH